MAGKKALKERKEKVAKLTKRATHQEAKALRQRTRAKQLAKRARVLSKHDKIGKASDAAIKSAKKAAAAKHTTHKAHKTEDRLNKARKYTTTEKGSKGIRNATITPFMTADDMLSAGEAREKYAGTLNDLDYALSEMRSSSAFDRAQSYKDQTAASARADSSAAGRGLFNSSIRDAALYDVDATAAVQRNELDRKLDTAALDTQRQKLAAQSAWSSFQSAMNRKMVENAVEATPEGGPWLQKPVKDKEVKHVLPIPKAPGKPDKPRNQWDYKQPGPNWLDKPNKPKGPNTHPGGPR